MASDNTSKPKPILITFDVDGTLIRAVGSNANKWHKDAFAFAMHEAFSIDTNIDVIKHHGSTDQLVLADVLKHHGFEETEIWRKMDELKSAMVSFAEEHKADAGLGLEILPGVEKLLQTLSERENIIVALVTGNLEPIAWRKMDTLGIKKYFTEKKKNYRRLRIRPHRAFRVNKVRRPEIRGGVRFERLGDAQTRRGVQGKGAFRRYAERRDGGA